MLSLQKKSVTNKKPAAEVRVRARRGKVQAPARNTRIRAVVPVPAHMRDHASPNP